MPVNYDLLRYNALHSFLTNHMLVLRRIKLGITFSIASPPPPEKKGGGGVEDFGARDIGGGGLDKRILGGLREKGE